MEWFTIGKKKKKDESITNLKEFGKFMNHSKNYNNHQKSCNSGLFWKERICVCMLAHERECEQEVCMCAFCWVQVHERTSLSMNLGSKSLAVKCSGEQLPQQGSLGNEREVFSVPCK